MNLQAIFITNGLGIFIILTMHYTSRRKVLRNRTEDKLFSIMLLGVMLGCFMEAFSYALDGHVFFGARALNYIANTYLFTANLLLPFCVLMYVEFSFGGSFASIRKKFKPQIIVGIIMLSTNIINFIVPINYYISEQNVYERRPFGYVFYAVILFYCISALVMTRRYEKVSGTKSFINIKLFLFPILLGAGLQFMFYGLSLAWLSAAVGLMGLYMMQLNETAFIDPLVGIYNRQYLNFILSSWISRGQTFAGVMLDVDYFKSINDNFGHSEGDQALKTVTDILIRARSGDELTFRFAGDEFIVLRLTGSENGLNAYMDRVNRAVGAYNSTDRPYRLSLSYGISFFTAENISIDTFMKEMDARMYKMKAIHHGQRQLAED